MLPAKPYLQQKISLTPTTVRLLYFTMAAAHDQTYVKALNFIPADTFNRASRL